VLVEDGFEIYHIGYIRSHSVRLKFQVLEDVGGIKEVEEVERLLRKQEEERGKHKREYKVLLYGRKGEKLVALVLEKMGAEYRLMCVDVNLFLADLRAMLGDL
jgi:N-methylhydantoinase A/oxoprolinase/acetone carboxylase beta subunit